MFKNILMKYINFGSGRVIILTTKYAIKIGKNTFGVTSNNVEIIRHRIYMNTKFQDWLAPIVFSIFNCIVIMRRVRVATGDDIELYLDTHPDKKKFIMDNIFHEIFKDSKNENYGFLNGRLVKLDYGIGDISMVAHMLKR